MLAKLLELRGTLDPVLARVDEATARIQLNALLTHVGNLLATGDLASHAGFLRTFLAIRAAEAQGPSAALGALVAICDAAVRVAQDDLGIDARTQPLIAALTQVTVITARLINNLVAEELESRLRQRRELSPDPT